MNALSVRKHLHNGKTLRSSTQNAQGISQGCFGGNFASRSRPRGAGEAKPESPAAARELCPGSWKVGGRVERAARHRKHTAPPSHYSPNDSPHHHPLPWRCPFPGISSHEEVPPPPSPNLWEASMNFLQQCGSYHVSFERTGFDTKQSALPGRSRKRLEAER